MIRILTLAGVISGLAVTAAHAGVTVSAMTAYGTTPPFSVANFGDAGDSAATLLSTATIPLAGGGLIQFQTPSNPNASLPRSGMYSGSTIGVAASPFNGTELPRGNYLSAEPNDPVTISLGAATRSFSLLWGSVDPYNGIEVSFFDGAKETGSDYVIGGDANAAAGVPSNGLTTLYVTITDTDPFNQIVLSSTEPATEFDPSVTVPAPASVCLFGFGLLGLTLARRRPGLPPAC